jgi:hypothetical protein
MLKDTESSSLKYRLAVFVALFNLKASLKGVYLYLLID